MQTEIEIKFFVTSNIQESLSNILNSLELSLPIKPLLAASISTRPIWVCVGSRWGCAFVAAMIFPSRPSKVPGQVVGGLHARPEYNAPVEGTIPTLSAFPADIWPSLVVRDELQSRLVAQFSTDFLRRHWLIAFGDAEIELAWDQGRLPVPGRTGIDELELELKSGDARALFTPGEQAGGAGRIAAGCPVKAQRGYRLAGLGSHWPCSPAKIEGKDQKASITLGLQHWQYHEQLWLRE